MSLLYEPATTTEAVMAVMAVYFPALAPSDAAAVVAQVEAIQQARREELERFERQLIPLLNTVRAQLGKKPIIAPKGDD